MRNSRRVCTAHHPTPASGFATANSHMARMRPLSQVIRNRCLSLRLGRFTLSPQAGGCRLEAGDERRDTRDACSAASHRNEALASPLRTMVDGSQLSVVSSRIPRDAGRRNTLHASRFTLFPQAVGWRPQAVGERRDTRYEIRDTSDQRRPPAVGGGNLLDGGRGFRYDGACWGGIRIVGARGTWYRPVPMAWPPHR